jgi:hypothetical protein
LNNKAEALDSRLFLVRHSGIKLNIFHGRVVLKLVSNPAPNSLAAASQGKKKRNHEVKLQRKGKRARVQTSTRTGLGKSRQA